MYYINRTTKNKTITIARFKSCSKAIKFLNVCLTMDSSNQYLITQKEYKKKD